MQASPLLSPLNISIHALREEGDIFCGQAVCALVVFLSTPSARRATLSAGGLVVVVPISIHALREEGDRFVLDTGNLVCRISIHALREEGDTELELLSNWKD